MHSGMFLSIDQSHWTTPYIRQICSGSVTNRITACLTIVVTWRDYCSYGLTTVILSEAVFNYASWLAVAGALCLCTVHTEIVDVIATGLGHIMMTSSRCHCCCACFVLWCWKLCIFSMRFSTVIGWSCVDVYL